MEKRVNAKVCVFIREFKDSIKNHIEENVEGNNGIDINKLLQFVYDYPTIELKTVDFAKRIGIQRPKVSLLSATEEVLESVPSSLEAHEITKRAKSEGIEADVFGPLAFDNSVSESHLKFSPMAIHIIPS